MWMRSLRTSIGSPNRSGRTIWLRHWPGLLNLAETKSATCPKPRPLLLENVERGRSHGFGSGGNDGFGIGSPIGAVQRRQLVRVAAGLFPRRLRCTADPEDQAFDRFVGKMVAAEILPAHHRRR